MSNPILNEENFCNPDNITTDGRVMTVNGTINKTLCLVLMIVLSAHYVWSKYSMGYTDLANILMTVGVIAGLILAFIIPFKKNKYLTMFYAIFEGFAIGGFSALLEHVFPGIVLQAVMGTFVVMFIMLWLYKTKLISCTEKFRSVVIVSTMSIAGVYLINLIGSFFGLHVPFLHSSSPIGICLCIFICVIAALNLIIGFDFIEQGEDMSLPIEYEWYGAFGIIITLIWLYWEILELIERFRSR